MEVPKLGMPRDQVAEERLIRTPECKQIAPVPQEAPIGHITDQPDFIQPIVALNATRQRCRINDSAQPIATARRGTIGAGVCELTAPAIWNSFRIVHAH